MITSLVIDLEGTMSTIYFIIFCCTVTTCYSDNKINNNQIKFYVLNNNI